MSHKKQQQQRVIIFKEFCDLCGNRRPYGVQIEEENILYCQGTHYSTQLCKKHYKKVIIKCDGCEAIVGYRTGGSNLPRIGQHNEPIYTYCLLCSICIDDKLDDN